MNVLRGTFRLSVVILGGVALAGAYLAHLNAFESEKAARHLWSTLRCGAKFLDQDMAKYTNEVGNIEIGRAGCGESPFLARKEEIRDALLQEDPSNGEYKQTFWFDLKIWTLYAIGTFLLVNFLGFAFLALRAVLRWIASGYQRSERN